MMSRSSYAPSILACLVHLRLLILIIKNAGGEGGRGGQWGPGGAQKRDLCGEVSIFWAKINTERTYQYLLALARGQIS